jgi:hypothetical protein
MKMIPLIEAFRRVLRARYPARLALADEIESFRWFWKPFDGSIRPPEEVQAAADACDVLRDAIASQSVRLLGRLNGARADDIHATEIDRRGIGIFTNDLEVYEPRTEHTDFKVLPRKYTHVHCYAEDIEALIGLPAPALVVTKDETPEEAAIRLIKAKPKMQKAALWHMARETIPRLHKKDFLRAWKRGTSPERQRGGRPTAA